MFDQVFNAVDGFVAAARQQAHDAVDKGFDALAKLAELGRQKLSFAAASGAGVVDALSTRADACRGALDGCEAECKKAGAPPVPTVGAGWDLGRVLKLVAIVRQAIDLLFPKAA